MTTALLRASAAPAPLLSRTLTPRAFAALCAAVILAGTVIYGSDGILTRDYADTDDALRMSNVRDLLAGQPWFDQTVRRLQPPQGMEMHWSRLVDGALAAVIGALGLLLGRDQAEVVTRTVWPVLWLVPAILATVAMARRLAGEESVLRCLVLLVGIPGAFLQFAPGRIDHHNIQIVCSLGIVAAVMHLDRHRSAGLLAGAITGLLVAVGLEALMFAALGGVAVALWLVARPAIAPAARGYAAALGASTVLLHAAQTAPSRWFHSVCDALAFNLVAAVCVASLGLLLACRWIETRPTGAGSRFAALAGLGGAAGAAYLGLNPACALGPFGEVSRDLWPVWLSHVREIQSLPTLWANVPGAALLLVGPMIALPCGLAILASGSARRDPAWLIAVAALALATAFAVAQTGKGAHYAAWFAAAVAAAFLARSAQEPSALASRTGLAALVAVAALIAAIASRKNEQDPAAAKAAMADCLAREALRPLAGLEPGLVLGEIDLGPLLLVHTAHSALAAPYHRMGGGILAAYGTLGGPPEAAPSGLRELGVRYVAVCAASGRPMPGLTGETGLYRRLKAGERFPWLETAVGEGPIRVFRVAADPVLRPTR